MQRKTKRFLILLAAGALCIPFLDEELKRLRQMQEERAEKQAKLTTKKDAMTSAIKASSGIPDDDSLPATPADTKAFRSIYGDDVDATRASVHGKIKAHAAGK